MMKIVSQTRLWVLLASTLITVFISGSSAAQTFALPPPETDVIGKVDYVYAKHEDTLADIAREWGLGYEEIVRANPDIDPWLPGSGSKVILPTQYVLPRAPREGVVVNISEMRLYYFPKPAKDEPAQVVTYPISVGRVDWATPLGLTKIVSKRKDPTWRPPASILKEHADNGDPLPSVVPPGPDNPLGKFALNLGIPGYLIHGTNKPAGVGMQVTHGCMRLYPENIKSLFESVDVGVKVRLVDQPTKVGWLDNTLYIEVHEALGQADETDSSDKTTAVKAIIDATHEREASIEWSRLRLVVDQASGLPVPISLPLSEQPALKLESNVVSLSE
ncbi:MAG: L,D-transpeptidase family protein [Gammaproteobacteria bacterium]|nr:L,D-transpeptidase family protein [Gammaproteobacteria bacterium]